MYLKSLNGTILLWDSRYTQEAVIKETAEKPNKLYLYFVDVKYGLNIVH